MDGVGVHWYMDFLEGANQTLAATHDAYPNVFILATEACAGAKPEPGWGPKLGDWSRGGEYAYDIISDLNVCIGCLLVGFIDTSLCITDYNL